MGLPNYHAIFYGETPFRLTYGSDAMLPIELDIPTYRAAVTQEETNDLAIWAEFDLSEKTRTGQESKTLQPGRE